MSIIAKYKFDSSIYADLVPIFNDGYSGYSITDEIDSKNNNHIIRTIECDTLPTKMQFGSRDGGSEFIPTPHEECLLEIIIIDTNGLTTAALMFCNCCNLTQIPTLTINNTVTNLSWMFHNCDKLTELDLSNFDTSNVTNMSRMFHGCKNLISIDVSNFDTSNVTNMQDVFSHIKTTSLDLSNWDTNKVENMRGLFYNCNKLTSITFGNNFNTSNVTDMSYMFQGCIELTTLEPLANWNIGKTTMYCMFNSCSGLTSLAGLEQWNIDNVTSMQSMFNGCSGITSLEPITNWNVDKVTNMEQIFRYCQSLTSLTGLENWNVGNITSMYNMFCGCTGLTSLEPLRNWNVDKVTVMNDMFYNCAGLTTLEPLANWNVGNVTSMHNMFYGCSGITSLEPITNWNVDIVTNMSSMFHGCSGLTSIEALTNWNVGNVTNMGDMFYGCKAITSIEPLRNWNVGNVTGMNGVFFECTGLTSIEPLTNWNVDKVTNMNGMFRGCSGITSIEALTNWHVDNVTAMGSMFYGCKAITSLEPLRNWNVDNVTQMNSLFRDCTGITSLEPLRSWNVENITDMQYTFYNCTGLTSLAGLEGWNVDNVTSMGGLFQYCSGIISIEALRSWNVDNVDGIGGMFHNCTGLTSVEPITNWNVNNVKDMSNMFNGCSRLISVDLSNWNTTNVENIHHMFHGCNSLTSITFGSNFNTINVISMKNVFNGCNALKFLDLSNWKVNNVTNMQGLFNADFECINIRGWENSHGQIPVAIQSLPANKEYHRAIISDIDATLNKGSHRISSNQIACYIANESGTCPVFSDEYVYTKEEIDNGDNTYTVNIYAESAPEFISFKLMSGLTHLVYLDTKNLTDIMDLFSSCVNLKQANVSSFDTSKVTNMQGLFYECRALFKDIHIANWDTKLVTNMSDMFYNCRISKIIGIEDIDTRSLVECYRMFYCALNLTSLDLNKWNTSKLTSAWGMFQYCYGLTDIKINKWDTSKTLSIGFLFYGTPISEINLNGWNTESALSMRQMFYSCPNIKLIDFSTVKITDGCNISDMFYHDQVHPVEMILCKDLNSVNKLAEVLPDRSSLSKQGIVLCSEATEEIEVANKNWTIKPPIIAAKYKFDKTICEDCMPQLNSDYWYYIEDEVDEENENYIIRTINGIEPPTLIRFGYNGGVTGLNPLKSAAALIDIYEVRTDNLTEWNHLFRNCINLKSITSNWYGSENAISMYQMFNACHSLTTINNLNELKTSNVTTMKNMFSDCKNLTSIDVSNFDTSNVTDMVGMFYNCQSLTSLNVSNWAINNVNAYDMFYHCKSLRSIDVSNWSIKTAWGMFNCCESLTSIMLPSIENDYYQDLGNIFSSSKSLIEINLNNVKTYSMDKVYDLGIPSTVRKIYLNDIGTLNFLIRTNDIRNFNTNEPCEIITPLDLDEETRSILAERNWIVNNNIIAQYTYDTNVYENLLPEFNAEFTEDMYTVSEDINEVVIDVTFEDGAIWNDDKEENERPYSQNAIRSKFIPVRPGLKLNTYSDKGLQKPEHNNWFWYDKDKKFISKSEASSTTAVVPANAAFVRIWQNKMAENESYVRYLQYKLVTRTIMSNDGTLPTKITFGCNPVHNKSLCLQNVYAVNTNELTNMSYMFSHCQNLRTLNVSYFNTSKTTNMNYMFAVCNKITSLDVSNWNTSNVKNMSYMFYYCGSLTELDVSNFDTSNVTNMSDMFSGCQSLISLDVSNFDTSEVIGMSNMFNNCNNLTSLDISHFDTSNATTMARMFNGCKLLTSITFGNNFDTSKVTTMQDMFGGCYALTELNVSNFNTSSVTTMRDMFHNCQALTSIDVSNWVTNNVTDMSAMFKNCNKLTELNVSNFDTSKVTNMSYMFCGCQLLTELDVSRFDTSKVTDMYTMFLGCDNLTSIDVSKWDTGKVTSMKEIFSNCKTLTSITFGSNWVTSNVTDISKMFWNCYELTELDLTNWNIEKVTDIYGLFYSCKKLKEIKGISDWILKPEGNIDGVFNGCESLTRIDVSKWDLSGANSAYSFFTSCTSLKYLNATNWSKENLEFGMNDLNGKATDTILIETDADVVFTNANLVVIHPTEVARYICNASGILPTFNEGFTYTVEETDNGDGTFTVKIKSDSLPTLIEFKNKTELLNVIWVNINGLISSSYMFTGCTNVTNINTINWDTKNIEQMTGMFLDCSSLITLDVSHFNTANAIAINSMFNGCTNLITLDVSNWNTGQNTNFGHLFNDCHSLVDLDVSKWNISNATVIDNMFKGCNSLTNLDVSNWNTSNVINMNGTFCNCLALKELNLSKWNTSKVQNTYAMFFGCKTLTRLDLTNFNTNEITNMGFMFRACELLEAIDIKEFIINEDTNITDMFANSNNLKLIRCSDVNSANKISAVLPNRTGKEYPGVLAIESKEGFTGEESMSAINWVAKDSSEETVIIEYEFDKSICEDLMPNISGSNPDSFIIFERENLSDNTFIRKILYYGNSAPTAISFNFEDERQAALIRVINLEADHLTRADGMFKNCINLIECNISGSTSNITKMDSMFYQCNNLTPLDVSNWDTSNVTNMCSMFWGCNNLISLDVSNWDVSQVTTTQWMFASCHKLVSLDLSNWKTDKLTNPYGMFTYCYVLEELDLSGFNRISLQMFYSCKNLKKIKNAYNITASTSLTELFWGCHSLESIEGIETWDTSNVTAMNGVFNGCQSLTSLNLSNWNTSNVTNMGGMFSGCNNLTLLDVRNWNTGSVADMYAMFYYCFSLKTINGIEDFDTKNCSRMESMFNKCKSLTYLNLNKWNVENVTSINMMFADCYKLKEIKIDKWDLKNIGGYSSLLINCKSLTFLTMPKNYSSINSLGSFAQNAYNLKVLDFSNFSYDINDEISVGNFLASCSLLTDIALLNHSEEQIDHFIKTLMNKSWLAQHITFWVDKNIDLTKLETNKPEYRTIKHYIEEDAREFYLTSPLLEGDRLEVINGDLYHYHKMGHIVLNGEEPWAFNIDVTASDEDNNVLRYNFYSSALAHLAKSFSTTTPLINNFGYCGGKNQDEGIRITGTNIGLMINQDKLSPFITVEDPNANHKKNALGKWLSINPIDVVYELANPHYELIQEKFDLIDLEKDNYFSIDGSTISINCQFDLCTIKPKYLYANTLYKVSFNANKAGEISIDLGGTLSPMTIVEGHNEIVLTTPATLSHSLLKVNGSTDIVIDNLMIIDSDKDFDSFEGINNTFDEIPVKNICSERTNTYIVGTDTNGEAPKIDLNESIDKGELVTVIGKLNSDVVINKPVAINLYNEKENATGKNLFNPNALYADDYCIEDERNCFKWKNSHGYGYNQNKSLIHKPIDASNGISVAVEIKATTPGVYPGIIYFFEDGTKATEGRWVTSVPTESFVKVIFTLSPRDKIVKSIQCFSYDRMEFFYLDIDKTQIEIETGHTDYEPYREYVNNEPIEIIPDENGNFCVQMNADRDYANKIALYIPNEKDYNVEDKIKVNDLMVFKGDLDDVYIPDWIDTDETNYLVEFKAFNNQFGFGKNKLI